MNNQIILIRYGEIALKSQNVRNRFENTLISRIKNAMTYEKINCTIKREWGRIYLKTEEVHKAKKVLSKIFGITSFSISQQTKSDIENIIELSLTYIDKEIKNENSFAVRTNRTGNHNFSSQDISIKVGQAIVDKYDLKVDLNNPEFELFIDARQEYTYVFSKKIGGVGGMPIGSQGNVLCIIDNLQSILASWYIIKRGCKPIFLIKNEQISPKVEEFIKKWYLTKNIQDKKNIEKICKNVNAIVTGHSLFTDENTIFSIKKLKNQYDLPILHPLISFDEKTIQEKIFDIMV